MKTIKIICLILFAISTGYAQDKEEDQFILFTNVKVWDRTAEKLTKADVLVKNNMISEVKANIKAPNGAEVIDQVLMPSTDPMALKPLRSS